MSCDWSLVRCRRSVASFIGLMVATLGLALFAPSAGAITYFYRATLDTTGGETWSYPAYGNDQGGLIDDFSGSGTSSWHAAFEFGINVDPDGQAAGLDAGVSGSSGTLSGTASGAWSGHGAYPNDPSQTPTPFSCTYSMSQAQFSGPITVSITGSGLDLGQPGPYASFAQSGRFGFSLGAIGGPIGPPPSCSGPAYPDLGGMPLTLFEGDETCQWGTTSTPLAFPATELGQAQIEVTGTFQNTSYPAFCASFQPAGIPTTAANASDNGTYHLSLNAFCPAGVAQPPDPSFDTSYEDIWDNERATLLPLIERNRSAIAAATADEHRNVHNDARDSRILGELRSYLTGLLDDYRAIPADAGERIPNPLVRTALTTDEQSLLNEASCGLLDQAKTSLDSYVEEHGTKNKKDALEFIGKLTDLEKVLNGDLKPTDPAIKKLLRSNMIALVERLAGAKPGVLAGKAIKLYDVLAGNLSAKELNTTLQSQVSELAQKVAGKNGAALAQQLFVLRDVLSGNQSADEQFQVLKESVLGLATRLFQEDVLKIPQVRAAMLGFDLGRPFGARVAADLRLIQQTVLARDCMTVLARAQGANGPADIDYSKPTQTFITDHEIRGTHYDGWICKILPDPPADDSKGGLVEAIEPVKFFGLLGGGSIYFDPAYAFGF